VASLVGVLALTGRPDFDLRLAFSAKEVYIGSLCIPLAYFSRIVPTQETLKSWLNQNVLRTVQIDLLIDHETTDEIKRK
jgi:hypothetical protein